MPTGTVKWFDSLRGFGFIAQDGGHDVFVHVTAVEKAGLGELREGQELAFDLAPGRDGRSKATNLRAVGDG